MWTFWPSTNHSKICWPGSAAWLSADIFLARALYSSSASGLTAASNTHEISVLTTNIPSNAERAGFNRPLRMGLSSPGESGAIGICGPGCAGHLQIAWRPDEDPSAAARARAEAVDMARCPSYAGPVTQGRKHGQHACVQP